VVVDASIYRLWQAGPWDLPVVTKPKQASAPEPAKEELPQIPIATTRDVIGKNLFDPERGATKQTEVKAAAEEAARQKIRSMTLLGTAILGNSRYAIMQEPSAAPRGGPTKAQPNNAGQMRLKLGDTVEGFKLSEIRDKSVVFTKGTMREEVAIDFFNPGAAPPPSSPPPTQRAPVPPRQAVPPRAVPRPAPGAEGGSPRAPQSSVERARNALRERQLQPPQQPEGRPPQRATPTNPENAPAGSP
jgi:hypothetical protein